eukprot:s1907_g10.t1
MVHEVVGDLPDGWRCVNGCFELDDVLYTAFRKGEANPRHFDLQGQQEFIEAKKLELSQYFNDLVWSGSLRPTMRASELTAMAEQFLPDGS